MKVVKKMSSNNNDDKTVSRRKFLTYMFSFPVAAGVCTPFALATGALNPPESLRPLPPRMAVSHTKDITDQPLTFTYDGYSAILFKRDKEFVAFSRICSHLGCVVSWDEKTKQFHCPCHGGVYDAEGNVVSGPPPDPLTRLKTWVEEGVIMVQQEVK